MFYVNKWFIQKYVSVVRINLLELDVLSEYISTITLLPITLPARRGVVIYDPRITVEIESSSFRDFLAPVW